MNGWINTLDKIVNHDGLNLLVGLFLLACAVNETVQEFEEEFSAGAHHGLIVFGLIHTLKSLSAVLKSAKASKK